MVTLNLKLYGAPLALLMLSAGFAAPKANAEPHGLVRTVEARFKYNPSDSPAEIYADLKRTADRACQTPGQRPLKLRKSDKDCAAGLLEAAVDRIARADLAAFHGKIQQG